MPPPTARGSEAGWLTACAQARAPAAPAHPLMLHSAPMTIAPQQTHPYPATADDAPRRGKPWTEDDFTELMRACRAGCGVDGIARRLGRTERGVLPQLRRLLPLDERHLPVDLALPRLRQLDRDGDYDWLSALAQRAKPIWELEREAQAERDDRDIAAFTDEELLSVAVAIACCPFPLQTTLTPRCADELHRRHLADEVQRRCVRLAAEAAERLAWHDDWLAEDWVPGIDEQDPFTAAAAPAPWPLAGRTEGLA